MGSPDELADQEPLMRPRIVRLLKNRPRLVDFGLREEFLDELDEIATERRKPTRVSERATENVLNRAAEAGRGPLRRRMESRIDEINKTVLENL